VAPDYFVHFPAKPLANMAVHLMPDSLVRLPSPIQKRLGRRTYAGKIFMRLRHIAYFNLPKYLLFFHHKDA